MLFITSNILADSDLDTDISEELNDRIRSLRQTQFRALQFQIDPHFLYNTLETIKWNAVAGVTNGYRVYRRGAGQSWVYVTTVTSTSYVDTSVKNATGYYRYTVRAVDSGRYSGYETGLLIKK